MGTQAALLAAVTVGALLSEPLAYRIGLPLMFLGFQLCMYLNRVHDRLADASPKALASRLGVSVVEGTLLALGACVFVPPLWVALSAGVTAGALSALSLLALWPLVPVLVSRRWLAEGVVILGSGVVASELRSELGGVRPGSAGRHFAPEDGAADALALDSRELKRWVADGGYSRIILTEPPDEDPRELAAALIECKASGIEVEQAVDSYGRLRSKLWLDGLNPEWLVYAPAFRASRFYLRFRRVADVALALTLLTLGSPLLALIALAIRLESPGPVLFWQERIGLNGARFMLAKFRSMREDAERASGPMWAQVGDPRVTRVGKLLRKFRLDELPQMFNVLKGEMSFIGPRPERPQFVEFLAAQIPYYEMRHSVKPGISGWAQVMYPYGASLQDSYEKLQFDLFYIQNISFAFDLRIFFKTFQVVLSGGGR